MKRINGKEWFIDTYSRIHVYACEMGGEGEGWSKFEISGKVSEYQNFS